MKIEHINKLILKFIGGGIVNFPTRFLKWIKVESCGCNGGSDDGGDDSGDDSQGCISLEDFSNFYISVIDDLYVNNYHINDTLQLSDFFDTSNINILKGLLTLGANSEANSNSSIYFDEYKEDPNSDEGGFNHSITLYPYGSEVGNIQVGSYYTHLNDGETTNESYDISFNYDSDTDTLTVLSVNTHGV